MSKYNQSDFLIKNYGKSSLIKDNEVVDKNNQGYIKVYIGSQLFVWAINNGNYNIGDIVSNLKQIRGEYYAENIKGQKLNDLFECFKPGNATDPLLSYYSKKLKEYENGTTKKLVENEVIDIDLNAHSSNQGIFNEGYDIEKAEAIELILYADNTRELYNQKKAIIKNIQRKIASGKYDHSLAPKLWMYWINNANKMYQREEGVSFDKKIRMIAAQEIADMEYEEIKLGNYTENVNNSLKEITVSPTDIDTIKDLTQFINGLRWAKLQFDTKTREGLKYYIKLNNGDSIPLYVSASPDGYIDELRLSLPGTVRVDIIRNKQHLKGLLEDYLDSQMFD